MIRKLWKPREGTSPSDDHTCGNCEHSIMLKSDDDRALTCVAYANVIDNGDGTVTVISPCSGLSNTYPKEIIVEQ